MTSAKKSLGQHFLTSTIIAQKIVKAGTIDSSTTVLEIGPGKGFLTEYILKENPYKVICVEKDDRMPEILTQRFENAINTKKLELIHDDILKYRLPDIPYTVIANIPYYITGIIIKTLLTAKNKPQKIVLLIQKEVAERIIAQNKKESILSLSVSLYGKAKIICNVPKKHFLPQPRVDSSVISIDIYKHPLIEREKEELFFNIIKTAFGQKRKKLSSSIGMFLKGKNLDNYMNMRPEDMSLQDWITITNLLFSWNK